MLSDEKMLFSHLVNKLVYLNLKLSLKEVSTGKGRNFSTDFSTQDKSKQLDQKVILQQEARVPRDQSQTIQ